MTETIDSSLASEGGTFWGTYSLEEEETEENCSFHIARGLNPDSLLKLLRCYDLSQELAWGNEELHAYFFQPAVMGQLIQFSLSHPYSRMLDRIDINKDLISEDRNSLFPKMACEILSSINGPYIKTFISNPTFDLLLTIDYSTKKPKQNNELIIGVFDYFLSFLLCEQPLSFVSVGYFKSIMCQILKSVYSRYTVDLLSSYKIHSHQCPCYIKPVWLNPVENGEEDDHVTKDNNSNSINNRLFLAGQSTCSCSLFFDLLVEHIYSDSIAELIVEIISVENVRIPITMLTVSLSEKISKHENYYIDGMGVFFTALLQCPQRKTVELLIHSLLFHDEHNKLYNYLKNGTSMENPPVPIFLILTKLVKFTTGGHNNVSNLVMDAIDEILVSCVAQFPRLLLPEDLIHVLDDSHTFTFKEVHPDIQTYLNKTRRNQYSMIRLSTVSIMECVLCILQSDLEKSINSLCPTLRVMVYIFFMYPWNSIIHNSLTAMMQVIEKRRNTDSILCDLWEFIIYDTPLLQLTKQHFDSLKTDSTESATEVQTSKTEGPKCSKITLRSELKSRQLELAFVSSVVCREMMLKGGVHIIEECEKHSTSGVKVFIQTPLLSVRTDTKFVSKSVGYSAQLIIIYELIEKAENECASFNNLSNSEAYSSSSIMDIVTRFNAAVESAIHPVKERRSSEVTVTPDSDFFSNDDIRFTDDFIYDEKRACDSADNPHFSSNIEQFPISDDEWITSFDSTPAQE